MSDQLILNLIDQCNYNEAIKNILKLKELELQDLYMAYVLLEQEDYKEMKYYLEKIKVDTLEIKYRIMYHTILAEYYLNMDNVKEVLEILNKILDTREISYKRHVRWYVTCLSLYAIMEVIVMHDTHGMRSLHQAKEFLGGNKYLQVKLLNIEGHLNTYLLEPDRALDCFTKALQVLNEIKLDIKIPRVYHNIGNLHRKFCNYSEAVKYFKQAYSLGNKREISITLMELVDVLIINGQYREGLIYIDEVMHHFRQTNDMVMLSNCYLKLGHLNRERKEFREAYSSYDKALQIQQSGNQKHRVPYTLKYMGINYLKQRDYTASSQLLHQALNLFKSEKNSNEVKLVDNLLKDMETIDKDEIQQNAIIFHHETTQSMISQFESQFANSISFDMSKFNQLVKDPMLMHDFDNLVFIANSSNDVVDYVSKICKRVINVGFDYDASLKSVIVNFNGHTFNYGEHEKTERKLFVLFLVMNNPFTQTGSKLWLVLYGKKFNIEEKIEHFIKLYGDLFKRIRHDTNRMYVLKFDLDDKNNVQDIPVLNNKYVASLIR